MKFQLTSKYSPTGDQPEAIKELTDGIKQGERAQVLPAELFCAQSY